MKKESKINPPTGPKKDFEGYPIYPASEDIYSQSINENDLDPEFLSENKTPNEENDLRNELDFSEDLSGDDLDVPGSEYDDEQEAIGNEDEENNYYSIGGDAHSDLDENDGSI